MGSKPWVQKDEPKTTGLDYSRSLKKSLFYFISFIWLFGTKTMSPKPAERDQIFLGAKPL